MDASVKPSPPGSIERVPAREAANQHEERDTMGSPGQEAECRGLEKRCGRNEYAQVFICVTQRRRFVFYNGQLRTKSKQRFAERTDRADRDDGADK
jgi:hypothetical protein